MHEKGKALRVAIDGYNIALSNGTGVATYGVELAAALRARGAAVEGVFGLPVPVELSLREVALFDALKRPVDAKRRTNRYQRSWYFLRSFRVPRPREVPLTAQVEKSAFSGAMPDFDRLISAAHLFESALTSFRITGRFTTLRIPNPPDIMHWTYPLPLRMAGSRNIYTLHDLVPLKLPYTTLDNKLLYGRVVDRCIVTAAQICTVSESSKRDIMDRSGISADRITNTYQTSTVPAKMVNDNPVDDARAVEGIFGLKHRNYFLYFGAIEPKKNVGRLIEAYLSLQTQTPLVIIGARAWQSDAELKLVPGGGAGGAAGTFYGHRGQTIIRLDYLSRELLVKVVRGARALVFPSLYEGFGLPVLEAMQLGTPVITSSTSSLPEVAGQAGILVDPYDVGELMGAMERLDRDEALGKEMSARGLDHAKLFSRQRYQDRLTELYRAAMVPQ